MMACLQVLSGPGEGLFIPLKTDRFRLGRNPDNHFVIPVTAVSRQHAQILYLGGRYFIEDTLSRNGTFVNNQAVSARTPLKNNDRVRICDWIAAFLPSRSGVGDALTPLFPRSELPIVDSDFALVRVALLHEIRLLMSPTPPVVPGYEFFTGHLPTQEPSADLCDFVELPDGRVAVLLGEVAGSGVSSALLAQRLLGEARGRLLGGGPFEEMMPSLNELFLRLPSSGDRHAVLQVAVLDPEAHRVALVSAGHEPPWICQRGQWLPEAAFSSDFVGAPLGLVAGVSYDVVEMTLSPGDCLVLCSDGAAGTRGTADEILGQEGLERALRGGGSARRVGEHLLAALRRYSSGPQPDDTTVICVSRNAELVGTTDHFSGSVRETTWRL
jgi:hypothetical protein